MLKESSAQLIQSLNELIKKYAGNDKIRNIIVDEFTARNMRAGVAVNILNERLLLSTLNIDDKKDLILLFVFTKSLFVALTHKETDEQEPLGEINEGIKIDPKYYFMSSEIEDYTNYKQEKKVGKSEQYVFHNMIEIGDKHWIGKISSQQLASIDMENEWIYNYETQRDPVINVYGTKSIRLDKAKALVIKNRLLAGLQFPDQIRVNVLQDGSESIDFNSKSGDLTIVSGTKNIFDGYHRKTANSMAIAEDANLNFNWGFAVTNFSEKKAQDFMVQINKQKPMKIEHTKNMDTSILGNTTVDAILNGDSEFALNIKQSDSELDHGGLVRKSVLSNSIEEVFGEDLTNRIEAKKIAQHIADVMDFIIGLKVEEFINNPNETKKTSYINHRNMFVGYMALSSKFFVDKKPVENWKEKVEEVLENIDFSKTNDFWKDNGLLETNMSKNSRNNIYKLFWSKTV